MPQKGQISQIKLLNELQEDEIRYEYFNGGWTTSYKTLGEKYGVNSATISRAVHNSCERSGKRAAKKMGLA